MRNFTPPRNCEDRTLVPTFQQIRDAIGDIHDSLSVYDVHVPLGGDRTFGLLTFPLSAGSADLLVYTVPQAPGRLQTWVLSRPIVWLYTALGASDTGTVQVRLGSTVGGNDIMTDQPVTNATTRKIIGGLSIATLGTAMLAANGYEAAFDPGTTIYARATTTGTITAGQALVALYSYFEPL